MNEYLPNVDAGRTDIVWGTVNDGPICHCVNAGEAKAPMSMYQKRRQKSGIFNRWC